MSGVDAMDTARPMVSVLMLSYNHAAYIRQALEGCLTQRTDFPFEIIVCDDASSDGTLEILQEYAERYDHIVLSLQACNTGGTKNLLDGLRRLKGKYVAFCEGDDYWTNPGKLQKQVEFLERNPDFSVCCHRVEILSGQAGWQGPKQYVYKNCASEEERVRNGIFHADEAIANYYFHTSSLVFRWRFGAGLPDWFRTSMCLDHFLFMLHAVEGKIKYFDDDMSVWRRHAGGWSWLQNLDKGLFFAKQTESWITAYMEMDAFFSYRFTLQIRERILLALRHVADLALRGGRLEVIRHLAETYGEYFVKPVLENAPLLDGLRLAFPEQREFTPPWATEHVSPPYGDGRPGAVLITPPAADQPERAAAKAGRSPGDSLSAAILDIPETGDSVWAHWTGQGEHAFFSSADQALLAWLWAKTHRKKLWAPSWYPASALAILKELSFTVRFYEQPLDGSPPSLDFLNYVEDSEAVVSMDYLGRCACPELAEAVLARPGLCWLEDRRHALLPERESRAQAVLYDPTSFFGVPDGALLVGDGLARLQPPAESGGGFFQAQVWNGLSLLESGRDLPCAMREKARLDAASPLPARAGSRLSAEILKRLPIRSIATARRKNWARLAEKLREQAWTPLQNVAFAPFAFPVRLPDALSPEVAQAALRAQGIFCPGDFYSHKRLYGRALLLPCDQGCGREEMEKTAKLVKRFWAGGITAEDIQTPGDQDR